MLRKDHQEDIVWKSRSSPEMQEKQAYLFKNERQRVEAARPRECLKAEPTQKEGERKHFALSNLQENITQELLKHAQRQPSLRHITLESGTFC